MNTTLLGLALLGAAFGASSSSDDEDPGPYWRHVDRRERDRKARRAEDKIRTEARKAGYKFTSNRADNARIISERRRDPVYSPSANKGRGGIVNLNVRGQRGGEAEVDTARRIVDREINQPARESANLRLGYDIEKLRKAINRGKKTTARRAAEQLRITVSIADDGQKIKLAKRVLKIAKERGMA